MKRRKFLKYSLASPMLAASGCGYTTQQRSAFLDNCSSRASDESSLVIDVHCHLLNAIDADYAAFAERRVLKTGSAFLPHALRRVRARIDPDTVSARKEANRLLDTWRAKKVTPVCTEGLPAQTELFTSDDGLETRPDRHLGDGRVTGFFSSRSRNAAILMAQFPQVDLFVPAIVDFYEGNTFNYPSPSEQMQYYSALALASEGRFLPMVSFHPERYAVERQDFHTHDNLDIVRFAIERSGAIGVKVHPSTGFDPLSNENFAALTGRLKKGVSCEDYRQNKNNLELHRLMDKGMRKLYALCDELDVPILTHGSPTLTANPRCMMEGDTFNDWTNSSQHWIEAIREKRSANPRVAFAHLAGGPSTADQLVEASKGGRHAHGSYFGSKAQDGSYSPSPWLQEILDELRKDKGDLWLDASVQNEIAYSQAIRENEQSETWTANKRGADLFKEAKHDTGDLARWYSRLFDEYPALKKRMMYGSDLHMPDVGQVSGGDAYFHLLANATSNEQEVRRRFVGLNAAEFLGLKKGRRTRDRLERFFSSAGVRLDDVAWMQKVDRDASLIS